ncbi:MAG: S41 family peptidase, partial [Pseudomonadota bacterium]
VKEASEAVSQDMGDQALFDLLSSMLSDIKDAHVRLTGEVDGEPRRFFAFNGQTREATFEIGERDGLGRGEASDRFNGAYWNDGVRDTLLNEEGMVAGAGRIRFGMVEDGIGYIAIVSEGGYTDEDEDDEFAALDAAMDRAIGHFEENNAEAVIVDLSVNFGGYDSISRAIASRFAEQRTFAYTKRAEDAPASPAVPLYINPSEHERFTGPVYLLTSDITVSAGEILTMSMRALPNVTHVGQKTRGALSDVLEKNLPNGWVLTLSNEVYTDSEGLLWEGRGIPPEIEIPVFDLDNPPAGHVDAVRAVVKLARERSAAH